MGLFDDFDIDMDDVKAASGFSFDDGFYEWTISEALRQNGTKNKPNTTFFIIKYNLDEAGTYWEWFTLAEDGDSHTKNAKRSLGYLKSRLAELGVPAAEMNDLEPEDLEGITGSFKLVTTKNDKGEFQNIRNFKVDSTEEEEEEPAPAPRKRRAPAAKPAPEPEDEDDEPEESDADIKARVAAKRAAREKAAAPAAKRAPRKQAAADDDEDENPFE